MKRIKKLQRLSALLAVCMLLAVMLSPCVYAAGSAAESVTYTFSELFVSPGGSGVVYNYPDDGVKPTVEVSGSDVTIEIPAIDDFQALTITGTITDEKTREVEEKTYGVWGPAGIITESFTIEIDPRYSGDIFHTDTGYGESYFAFDMYESYSGPSLFKIEVVLKGVLERNGEYDWFKDVALQIYLSEPYGTPLVVTGDAQAAPGEDAGVEFGSDGTVIDYTRPGSGSDIAKKIGAALGAVAVAAGAGAAVSGDKKKNSKKKNAVSYKMYIYKDFGDAIRKGARPVRVCARITKIEDGKETNDLKLTSAIVPSAEGLVLASRSMYGQYMAANVSADRDYPGDSGTSHR